MSFFQYSIQVKHTDKERGKNLSKQEISTDFWKKISNKGENLGDLGLGDEFLHLQHQKHNP